MIYPNMADFEMILACTSISKSDKYNIVPIGDDLNPIVAESGHTYIPKRKIKDIPMMQNIEGLIIPGGCGMIASSELIELIKNLHSKNKMLAAICIGPEYLATAGILDELKYTTSMKPEYYIENGRSDPFNWENNTNTRIWLEKNIITAKGEAFVEFALKIWEYLEIMTHEELQTERAEFTPEWCQ